MMADVDLLTDLDVSRETLARLEAFVALMKKWNPAINLVSRSTIDAAWQRHILDSAQIYRLAPEGALHWVDIGSGGGFPGVVVAIIARQLAPQSRVTLIDSDQRKAAFLREACRVLDLNADVLAERIESVPPQMCDVLTARALASLPMLCGFAQRHLAPGGTALFLKGASHATELSAARQDWTFDAEIYPSATDANAVILKLKGLVHG